MGTSYNYSEGATYQSETTPIVIKKIPAGDYKIKAVKGGLEGRTAFTAIPGRQDIIFTIAKSYSIIYDKSLATDPVGCLTYAGKCTGFTPMSGGSGNADEGSWAEGNGTLFDAIKVGYLNSNEVFVEQSKNAVPGSSTYNCFTRIPKIYQKVTQLDENRVQLDLDLQPFDGATLHPAFIMDGVELTYKDIGRYIGYNNSSKLESKSGNLPTGSTIRADLRRYAKANGSKYGMLSYYDWDLVNKLYLFAFKSFDSQSALGLGQTGADKVNTGGTDGHSWMYGISSSASQVSFLGLEDWWGNNNKLLDNYLTDSSKIYVSNTASPSDTVNDMTVLCSLPKVNGVIPLTCRAGLNDFFIGETTGGKSSSGMCDKQNFRTGTFIARVGGNNVHTTEAGAFFFESYESLSTSYSSGACLVHWE